MCYGCWEGYGRPVIDNAQVRAAAELVNAVYAWSSSGGNLHVELDDWNIDDCFFEEFKPYNPDVPEERLEAERQCFTAFKALSLVERASTLALHSNYWQGVDVGQL